MSLFGDLEDFSSYFILDLLLSFGTPGFINKPVSFFSLIGLLPADFVLYFLVKVTSTLDFFFPVRPSICAGAFFRLNIFIGSRLLASDSLLIIEDLTDDNSSAKSSNGVSSSRGGSNLPSSVFRFLLNTFYVMLKLER